jgi:hypothetical protein
MAIAAMSMMKELIVSTIIPTTFPAVDNSVGRSFLCLFEKITANIERTKAIGNKIKVNNVRAERMDKTKPAMP